MSSYSTLLSFCVRWCQEQSRCTESVHSTAAWGRDALGPLRKESERKTQVWMKKDARDCWEKHLQPWAIIECITLCWGNRIEHPQLFIEKAELRGKQVGRRKVDICSSVVFQLQASKSPPWTAILTRVRRRRPKAVLTIPWTWPYQGSRKGKSRKRIKGFGYKLVHRPMGVCPGKNTNSEIDFSSSCSGMRIENIWKNDGVSLDSTAGGKLNLLCYVKPWDF